MTPTASPPHEPIQMGPGFEHLSMPPQAIVPVTHVEVQPPVEIQQNQEAASATTQDEPNLIAPAPTRPKSGLLSTISPMSPLLFDVDAMFDQ